MLIQKKIIIFMNAIKSVLPTIRVYLKIILPNVVLDCADLETAYPTLRIHKSVS